MAAIARSITVACFLLGLTLTASIGCNNSGKKWIGEWEGDLQRADPSMPNDATSRTINLLRIRLLPNGTFEMLESGISKSGTHQLGSERAYLTVTRVMDRNVSDAGSGTKEMNLDLELTWQEDGTILFRDPASFDRRSVRLTRTTQP